MDEDSPLYVKSEAEQAVLAWAVGRCHFSPWGAHPLTQPVRTWPESPLSSHSFHIQSPGSLIPGKYSKNMAVAPEDVA